MAKFLKNHSKTGLVGMNQILNIITEQNRTEQNKSEEQKSNLSLRATSSGVIVALRISKSPGCRRLLRRALYPWEKK